jgi:hypothetical protein
MRKLNRIIVGLMAVLIVSCVSTPASAPADIPKKPDRKVADNVPDAIKKAVMEAPGDVIIGIGAAKQATLPMSLTAAEQRARLDITKQINSVTEKMVINYTDSSGIGSDDKVLFTETITRTISKANLDGSTVIGRGTDDDGYAWCAVSIPKEKVADQIYHARNESIVTVPAMGSFKTEDYFEEAFTENFNSVLGSGAK